METRIIKIEKGKFLVEYRKEPRDPFTMVDKKFKSRTKAEDFIREKLGAK